MITLNKTESDRGPEVCLNAGRNMYEFMQEHAADDVVYALRCPEYFELTDVESGELHRLVFQAIRDAKDNQNFGLSQV